MQCVILCAGKGTRMRPLTESTPKPLIEVCGKPLLRHVVDALPEKITELVLVVGYLEDQIRDYCGSEFCGRPVTYVTQCDFSGGTGDALMCAKDYVTGPFLFIYSDDIHGAAALQKAVQHEHAILAATSERPEHFGVIELNPDHTLKGIIEKPSDPPSNLVNIGGFILNPEIFDYEVAVSKEHDELLATDFITAYSADHSVQVVEQDLWIPVGRPEDVAAAEGVLCPEKDIDKKV